MKLYKCFPYYYCKCKIKFNQYKGKQLNFCFIYIFSNSAFVSSI